MASSNNPSDTSRTNQAFFNLAIKDSKNTAPSAKVILALERNEIPPDSGYAWVIMAASFVNFLFAFGSINAFGVFQTYYLVKLFVDVPADRIAWISTMCMFCTLAAGLFASPLIRIFGLRYSSLLGTLLGSLGLILASFSTQVWQLVITQGILFGSGCAIIVNISLTAPALWFDKRKNLAIGIVTSGGGFGALVLIPVTTRVVSAVNIAWAFRVLCVIFFVATGICGYLIVPRIEYKPASKILDTKLMRNPIVLILCALGFFMEIGFNVPILYFPASVISFGISESVATNLIMVFSVTSAFGRLFAGYASKKLGSENIIIVFHSLTSVVFMALWYTSSNLITSLSFWVLFGLFGVPFFALGPIIISQNYKSEQVSQINAISYLFLGMGILISVPTVGLIFEKLGNRKDFHQIIILAAVAYFISALSAILLKIALKRRNAA